MSPKYDSADSLLEAVESVLPLVRDGAEASETAGRISDEVLAAFYDKRLFRLFIPRDLDGEEVDLPTALNVFERLSSADGATGWTVMIGAGAGLFAGFLARDVAREIFLEPKAVIAGSGAATGIARRSGDGYQVSGRWAYASGAHHATWFTANCVVEDAGSADAELAPLIRSIAVPAADVEIFETWSVTGMRGTGSDDIGIADAFVPLSHTFSATEDAPRAPGPLYRFPFYSLAELSFAAVSLGIARHALSDFADMARSKRPMGTADILAKDSDVQSRFAKAEAAVSSARAFVFEAAQGAWRTVENGDSLSRRERALVRLASVDAVHRCSGAVDVLYARAGMTPLFSSSSFGRAWRDAHAVSQNMVVSAGLYAEAGRDLLEPE